MKQAVAPKLKLPDLWSWAEGRIDPDVVVFTEARVPKDGVPAGWSAHWDPAGIDPKRRWGTVMAARDIELREVTSVRVGMTRRPIGQAIPGTTVVADVVRDGERWAAVVGLYGLNVDRDGKRCGHGLHSMRRLVDDLSVLFRSRRGERLVLAGDFNLWPRDVHSSVRLREYGLVDLVEYTSRHRRPLTGCASCAGAAGCGHLWTHRNGNSPNAAVQQIDYILATEAMLPELLAVYGGVGNFEDAWTASDHAPVVAEFV